jgi:hypothetical protein
MSSPVQTLPAERWPRFWSKPDANISIDQDGLLAASFTYGDTRFVPSELRTLEELEDTGCLMLLGEPGIGKSRTLRQEHQRLIAMSVDALYVDLSLTRDERILSERLFGTKQFEAWAGGEGKLVLLLDSLDEARLQIGVVASIVLEGLRDLDRSRLRLRLACRTAERLVPFEAELMELWGADNFEVFELAPLTRDDIAVAAVNRGLDSDQFLKAVRARAIGPLAARPLTLNMLLDLASTAAGLPDSQIELYDRALLHLATEPREERRRDPVTGPTVEPRARIVVASRIAAATVLSARARVATAMTAIPTNDAVTIAELAGGEERDTTASLSTAVEVTDRVIGEVLGSALFSARGADLGWAHQTYAEHLAARYLSRSSMSLTNVLNLLGSHQDEPRVAPQLRDVAGIAAAMNRRLFDELAVRDPLVLLRGDLRHADDHQKRTLVNAILDPRVVLEVSVSDPRTQRALASLSYNGVEDDLRTLILDNDTTIAVRHLACRLVEFCALSNLEGEVLTLALDESADLYTRVLATRALGASASRETRQKLIPLARDPQPDDEDDDLKAAALEAVCPAIVPVADVFAFLTPRKADAYFGGYASFLSFEMALLLNDSTALLPGLRWVQGLPPHENPTDGFAPVAELILARAAEHLDEPGIPDELADAITTYFADGHSFRQFRGEKTVRALTETSGRRALLSAFLKPIRQRRLTYMMLLFSVPEIAAVEDVPWMLEQLMAATNAEDQATWSGMICQLARDPAADHEAIWAARESNSAMDEAAAALYGPVELDSDLADAMRESYQLQQERAARRAEADRKPVTAPQDLSALLDRFDAGEEVFLAITAALWGDGDARSVGSTSGDFAVSSGWKTCEAETRIRIEAAAETYICRFLPPVDWPRAGIFYGWQISGYNALVYLNKHRPDRLAQISEATIRRWIAAVLATGFASGRGDAIEDRSSLLGYLKSRAPAEFATAVKERVLAEAANGEGFVPVLHRLRQVIDSTLGQVLFEIWKTQKLSPQASEDILESLLESEAYPIREEAVATLTPELVDSEPERATRLVTALIAADVEAAWEPFRGLWDTHTAWAKAVFLAISSRSRRGDCVRQNLDDDQLADLFIWLSDAFPRNDDPSHSDGFTVTPRHDMAHYRDHILTLLADRGTETSIAAMDRMAAATEQTFPYARVAAETTKRMRTWTPPSPAEIVRLGSDPRLRLLRSDADLRELLVNEALPQIQHKLQHEGQAHQIWDTHSGRPKQETEIAAWIADRLRDDLTARGVVINREVEVRVGRGGIGERTDIRVDATTDSTTGTADQLTVIIEVKGCWHRELLTAMSTQLADQYLSPEHAIGIYLVAWFGDENWTDATDKRRLVCQRQDANTIVASLTQQAEALHLSNYRIEAVILDCTW